MTHGASRGPQPRGPLRGLGVFGSAVSAPRLNWQPVSIQLSLKRRGAGATPWLRHG